MLLLYLSEPSFCTKIDASHPLHYIQAILNALLSGHVTFCINNRCHRSHRAQVKQEVTTQTKDEVEASNAFTDNAAPS